MKSTGVLAIAALLTTLIPFVIAASVPFTLNGYDVDGGTDPICWTLPLWNASQATFQPKNFQMQPACPPGTTLKITPLDLYNDRDIQIMYYRTSYTFEIEASAEYNAIASLVDNEVSEQDGSFSVGADIDSVLYFRVILCDMRRVGFCSPVKVGFLDLNITEYESLEREWWVGNVTDGEELQAVNIGNHLFSPWLVIPMDEVKPNEFHVRRNISLRLPAFQAGTLFVIGHGHLSVPLITANESGTTGGNSSDGFAWIEVGDAVPNNVVEAQAPPRILEVSDAMKIGLGVVSGIFALFSLLVLAFIVHHRDHVVMKLAQWQFLSWLVVCALVSYVFLFTFMPTKDWHCYTSNFLEFVPVTMAAAILVGRSWRVFVTVSQAMKIGAGHQVEQSESSSFTEKYFVGFLTAVARFPYNFKSRQKQTPARGGFRQKATAMETTRLILWISFPQTVLQAVGMFAYSKGLDTIFDNYNTVGRVLCHEEGQWVRRLGIVLVGAAYSAAVILSWVSRDLPSAFNESHGVFQAATINTIVTLLAFSLDQITKSALSSPDVTAFLWASTSLVVSSTAIGCIVMPKVMRVRSGEKVVISDLLAQTRESQSKDSMHPTSRYGTSHLSPEHSAAMKGSIHLGINDPIPKGLERNMLGANELILEVRDELVQGRTPILSEWRQLITKVDELHEDLNRLHFDWSEEDEDKQ